MNQEKRTYRNPVPTVDTIIEMDDGRIVLIKRKNYPKKWAIPGGYVDYGESLEAAAVREAEEETSLRVDLERQLHTYSDPTRDDRQHTISTVFIGHAAGEPRAADDAEAIGCFHEREIPSELGFDHEQILRDYFRYRRTGELPRPVLLGRGPREAADRAVDAGLATEDSGGARSGRSSC